MLKINQNSWINRLTIGISFIFYFSSLCAEKVDYSIIEKNLKKYENKIIQLKDSIDNTIVDDQELIISLDFDAEKIITYVKDNIVFQAYDGLLRGIQGSLIARSGNALDQSVLLAKMLGDAGYDVRVVEGELSDDFAKKLLLEIQQANLPQHIGKGPDFDKALAAFSPDPFEQVQWQKTETYLRFQKTKTMLEPLLTKHNIDLKDINITEKLISQVKKYFWVEYRLGVSDPWQSAHPAFKTIKEIPVKATTYIKGAVPEKYLHQVQIESFIEQRIGSELKTHALMKPWKKPSANLLNVAITYSNYPSGLGDSKTFDLKEIIKKSTFFTPIFNGRAVGDKVFDLKGQLIDAASMNTAAGALFQTIGDKTLMAAEGLNGKKPSENSIMQLTAQWLQFTFISPDGSKFTQKRFLYQAPKVKNDEYSKTQLLSEYVFVNNSSEQSITYLASVYLDLINASMPLFKASTDFVLNQNNDANFPKELETSGFEILAQYYWMNNNPTQAKNVIRYRTNSNMLGIKRGYVNAEKAFLAVDVIHNKQVFLKRVGTEFFHTAKAAFNHGIWETASEWLPAKIAGLAADDIDTLKITAAAKQQNIEMVIHHPNDADLSKIKSIFSENQQAYDRINSDIKKGYLVIIPAQKPKDLKMSGWWRINPTTGETLGMTADGGGQSAAEYLIPFTQQALTLIRAVNNLKKCQKISDSSEKICCLMQAHYNNVTGLAVGSFVGAVGGVLGSAIFDIIDFTKELVTGSGLVPGVNLECENFRGRGDF